MLRQIFDVGSSRYELGRDFLSVECHVLTIVDTLRSCLQSSYQVESPDVTLFMQDYWISRGLRFEIVFEIFFAPDLFCELDDQDNLTEMLKQSILAAELWKRVGLQLQSKVMTTDYYCNRDSRQFAFLVTDAANYIFQKESHCHFDYDNIRNMRAPSSINSHQLKTVLVSLDFCSIVGQTPKSRRVNSAIKSSSVLQLTDAVLRSILCVKPARLSGIAISMDLQYQSLARLAPSTFVPECAEAVANRAKFIEPIAKVLLLYKMDTKHFRCKTSVREPVEETEDDTERERDRIEADLWMTMTNMLTDRQPLRRLPPLRPVDNSVIKLPKQGVNGVFISDHGSHDPEPMEKIDYRDGNTTDLPFESPGSPPFPHDILNGQDKDFTVTTRILSDMITQPTQEPRFSESLLDIHNNQILSRSINEHPKEVRTTPIITSGMVFQLLAGTHLIDVNLDLESDREHCQTAQELFCGESSNDVQETQVDNELSISRHAKLEVATSFEEDLMELCLENMDTRYVGGLEEVPLDEYLDLAMEEQQSGKNDQSFLEVSDVDHTLEQEYRSEVEFMRSFFGQWDEQDTSEISPMLV